MAREWIIGADPSSDLVVNLPVVSTRHCRLSLVDGVPFLEDLGSTNGTYLNGNRVTQGVKVSPADSITLGLTTPMPWPPELLVKTPPVLTIGREPDNDIVIDLPVVSGRHARIIAGETVGNALIEDLNSSNGVSIETLDRKVIRTPFTAADILYIGTVPVLGAHLIAALHPLSIPALAFQGNSLLIGRDPACEYVIDEAIVSGRHARLGRSAEGTYVEDLGSSNGTFVNGVAVEKRTAVRAGDILGFGSMIFQFNPTDAKPIVSPPATKLIDRNIGERDEPNFDFAIAANPQPAAPTFADTFLQFWKQPTLWISLLLIAPVLALLIALVFRSPDSDVALILFWTAFSAIACGLGNAFASRIFDKKQPGSWTLPYLGSLAASTSLLGLIQSTWIWVMVAGMTKLEGAWLPALGLLMLGLAVGLALGFLAVIVARQQAVAAGVLVGLLLAFVMFGGGPLTPNVARPIANAVPTRWVYEGLLLLDADPNLAENDFPATTEQMGVRADVLALVFMLVGFAGGAAFLSTVSASGLRSLSEPALGQGRGPGLAPAPRPS